MKQVGQTNRRVLATDEWLRVERTGSIYALGDCVLINQHKVMGDVLFSCAIDRTPVVWYADTGELLGTYHGHTGAVWGCDVSRDSKLLITASADQTTKLWDVQTGAELFTFQFKSTAKSVEFSVGDKLAVIATDSFSTILPSAIHVKHIASDPSEQCGDSVVEFSPGGRSNRAVWGPLNRTIISGGEDGVVRVWDVETMTVIHESDKETGHQKAVTSLTKSVDGSHLLTGSIDKSAKLWDIRSLKLVKTYKTENPVNAVTLSPLLDHVVLGGGQDASTVANYPHAGKFEAKYYHKVLEEEIGAVKGHFGPINALAFNPDGKSFSSGGEDGLKVSLIKVPNQKDVHCLHRWQRVVQLGGVMGPWTEQILMWFRLLLD